MSNNKYKVLLVEDEASIRDFVQTIMESNSYQVLSAETGAQGHLLFLSHQPDLVILDLGLPDMDGLDFIRLVRKSSPVPIVILSARTQEWDKVSALDLGANDYITKPFGTSELLARVRVALRSSRGGVDSLPGGKFTLAGLVIDYEKRMVTLSGAEIRLTQTEYNILAVLAQHAGKMMTYSAIVQAVWGGSDPGSVKKLQVNMANIRKKMGSRPGESRYIVNELGVGYRMRGEVE